MATPTRYPARTILWVSMALIIISCIAGLFYYHIAVLEPEGKRYASVLAPSVKQLASACNQLAQDSDRLLAGKALTNHSEKASDIEHLRVRVRELRADLRSFQDTMNTLEPHILPLTSGEYNKSLALNAQAQRSHKGITEVVNEYEGALDFLVPYYALRQQLIDSLEEINSVEDLDTLGSYYYDLYATADLIKQKAASFSAIKPPRGFEDLATQTILNARSAEEGIRALADSYLIPTDAGILAAAVNLETITVQTDTTAYELLEETIQNNPVIRGVSDLPEVIDRFKF